MPGTALSIAPLMSFVFGMYCKSYNDSNTANAHGTNWNMVSLLTLFIVIFVVNNDNLYTIYRRIISFFTDMFGSFGGGGGKRKGNRGWNPFDVFNNFGFNFDFPNTKFKQYDLNEIPAGSKKVIRDGNGQGVMFRYVYCLII